MGLLFRVLKKLYLIGVWIIQASLIDDPYQNQVFVGIANFLTILALLFGFGIALYLLVKAVSLKIFLDALLIAYWLAWNWEQLGNDLTSFAQEMYLICSTLGYTVIFGTLIQIHRMQWADAKALLFYWLFLLILGFILWRVTVFNVATAGVKPVLAIRKIEYKQRFRLTKIPKEIPPNNQAQAYLKKMK